MSESSRPPAHVLWKFVSATSTIFVHKRMFKSVRPPLSNFAVLAFQLLTQFGLFCRRAQTRLIAEEAGGNRRILVSSLGAHLRVERLSVAAEEANARQLSRVFVCILQILCHGAIDGFANVRIYAEDDNRCENNEPPATYLLQFSTSSSCLHNFSNESKSASDFLRASPTSRRTARGAIWLARALKC